MGSVLKPILTLKEYFWCHVFCAHLGAPWYQIVGASCTVSNRGSRYPRHGQIRQLICTVRHFMPCKHVRSGSAGTRVGHCLRSALLLSCVALSLPLRFPAVFPFLLNVSACKSRLTYHNLCETSTRMSLCLCRVLLNNLAASGPCTDCILSSSIPFWPLECRGNTNTCVFFLARLFF